MTWIIKSYSETRMARCVMCVTSCRSHMPSAMFCSVTTTRVAAFTTRIPIPQWWEPSTITGATKEPVKRLLWNYQRTSPGLCGQEAHNSLFKVPTGQTSSLASHLRSTFLKEDSSLWLILGVSLARVISGISLLPSLATTLGLKTALLSAHPQDSLSWSNPRQPEHRYRRAASDVDPTGLPKVGRRFLEPQEEILSPSPHPSGFLASQGILLLFNLSLVHVSTDPRRGLIFIASSCHKHTYSFFSLGYIVV